jgi:hypothetical protein
MNNGGTGRDALGGTQFLVGEHSSVTNHKGITAVAFTLASFLLACTVYTFWGGGKWVPCDATPNTTGGGEIHINCHPTSHYAALTYNTLGVVGASVTVSPVSELAVNKYTISAKRALGTKVTPLEIAVVGERRPWPICTPSNNLLKRHA